MSSKRSDDIAQASSGQELHLRWNDEAGRRLAPRFLMLTPERFGKPDETRLPSRPGPVGDDTWAPPKRDALWRQPASPRQLADLSFAFLQHIAAIETRKALRLRRRTIRDLAIQAGETQATVGKKLNGFLWATYTDLLLWAFSLDRIAVLKEVLSFQDLLPTPSNMEDQREVTWAPLDVRDVTPRGQR